MTSELFLKKILEGGGKVVPISFKSNFLDFLNAKAIFIEGEFPDFEKAQELREFAEKHNIPVFSVPDWQITHLLDGNCLLGAAVLNFGNISSYKFSWREIEIFANLPSWGRIPNYDNIFDKLLDKLGSAIAENYELETIVTAMAVAVALNILSLEKAYSYIKNYLEEVVR